MKLSIIIVNYNVKHFLEQCLHSVYASVISEDYEVFVVDNNSVDGSCAMVKHKFPKVKLIENKENVGFAKANNQAIRIASGKYMLLLNPDTLVEENSFDKIVSFMDSHPDAGGLGVKMINGKGEFLPESKRGLPTPMVSFFKIFGLAKLFPNSRRFGQYHLSYLNKDEISKVDVLSGAFMLLRKTVLDKIGLLDEAFFMYGEDIDLSYRITQVGYNNYYYPNTTIIHYKGESTKKGSINYVIVFYKAMLIFAKKHFAGRNAGLLIFIINIAIYFRATLAIFNRLIKKLIVPAIDAILFTASFFAITFLWAYNKYGVFDAYPEYFLKIALPVFWLIWMLSLVFAGGYDKPLKFKNLFNGMILGSLLILLIYSLLPEHFRFSRAVIVLVSLSTMIVIPIIRYILNLTGLQIFKISLPGRKRIVFVGKKDEIGRIEELILQVGLKPQIVGYVSPCNTEVDADYLGSIEQLNEIIKIHKVDEIIFCSKDIEARHIIRNMLRMADEKIDFKIAGPDSVSVIGSNSINTPGELYSVDINSIAKPENRRKKRLVDLVIGGGFLIFSPVIIWFGKKPFRFLCNIVKVIVGIKTFVGYYNHEELNNTELPSLRPSIISPADRYKMKDISLSVLERSNIMYAKDYKLMTDITIIFKCFKKLWE
ncbi:MAG TPA: glycosyltransferase [Bacteroidales bacterium]|nr:glycosyltransferase [Bacteroidales bacterium]